MLHRNKKVSDYHAGKYNGLGGKAEPGESPEDCVIREVKEESGYTLQGYTWHGHLFFPGFTPGKDWLVFIYTSEEFTGQELSSPEGTLHWIKESELLQLPLWPGDLKFLPWIMENKLFSGEFLYENGEFKDYRVTFLGDAVKASLTKGS